MTTPSNNKLTLDPNLIRVTTAVVQAVGLKAVLLALAAVCHARAIECVLNKPQDAETWTAVADDIEVFARTSLRGLP